MSRFAERTRRAVISTTLDRCLGIAGILFLALSVTMPASSVFVIAPAVLQIAGTGALWAFIIAGMVSAATALAYAELSSAWPIAGGEYVMAARTLGPLAGFTMLGVNVFNNLLFPPVAALGVVDVASTLIPLPQVPVAVAVIAGATVMGVFNIRVNAVVTGIFLLVEMATLTVVFGLGAASPRRGMMAMLAHPIAAHGGALVPVSAASIGVATSIAIFALNGFGAAVYFGEEMQEAPTRIARAILLALLATLGLELIPIAAALSGAPDLARFLAASNPFGRFVAGKGGPVLGSLVALGVAIATVNAVIAGVLASARFCYATARDNSWSRPINDWLVAIHPRFASPTGATLFSGGVGMAACFVPLRLLLVLSGAGLIVIYAGVLAAAVVGRRGGATAHGHYRMPLYPLAPMIAGAALVYVTWLNWLDPGDGRTGLIATAAQIIASGLYYVFVIRQRGWSAR